jgi:SAM-dependent methyltransferase
VSRAYELVDCPVCDAATADVVATGEELRAEVEDLWLFHTRRIRGETPPQALTDRVVFSQEPALRLVRCTSCGSVYRNPCETERTVKELYEKEHLVYDVLRRLFDAQRRSYERQVKRLTRLAGRSGRGLEVGSYVGAFLAAARERGWNFEGIDVNACTNWFARSHGLRVQDGSVETVEGSRFDVVAFWNCFDQLPDPRSSARTARDLLAPGGILAVRVPNGNAYVALRAHMHGLAKPMVRALLAHNNLLGFPYLHGFTPRSLEWLLRGAGFDVIDVVGDTLVPMADGWTRRWAAWEERSLKLLLRLFARTDASPWIEMYARNRGD